MCALGLAVALATQYFDGAWACAPGPDKPVLCALDLTNIALLPIVAALVATCLLMGWNGFKAFVVAVALLMVAGLLPLLAPLLSSMSWASIADRLREAETWIPWSLNSPRDAVIAWAVIGIYLIVNAAFLQPYLGDAARYFRNAPSNVAVRREIRKQAVETLANLHRRGRYDRIVVVAHSMGCVVAYDMLRTYFGRANRQLPGPAELGKTFTEVDNAAWDCSKLADSEQLAKARSTARELVAGIARIRDKPQLDNQPPNSWLVTDFVTLGNALTHAKYLTSIEKGETQEEEFKRHVDERDFPTCPPKRIGGDGLLSFKHETLGTVFHHGAMFGLTRWTNLYFEREQIFWGDAIGGPVAPTFGCHILDVPVWTNEAKRAGRFTHNSYWDVEHPQGRKAPHIVALRKAIDLEDCGSALQLEIAMEDE